MYSYPCATHLKAAALQVYTKHVNTPYNAQTYNAHTGTDTDIFTDLDTHRHTDTHTAHTSEQQHCRSIPSTLYAGATPSPSILCAADINVIEPDVL